MLGLRIVSEAVGGRSVRSVTLFSTVCSVYES